MVNKALAIVCIIVVASSLCLAAPAEKDSNWLKSLLNSEELNELESKEGSNDDSTVILSLDKRPSWVSGRDLSNSDYYRLNSKRIIEFKRDLEDQLALIKNMLKSQRGNKKLRF